MTITNQLTQSAPMLYRPPKINMGDLPTLHRLLANELQKLSQSQSYLMTLWQQSQEQAAEIKALRTRLSALEAMQPVWGKTE